MIEIIEEKNIPWQLQHKIHKGLNMAFDGLSKKFSAKTYAEVIPFARSINLQDDAVVSHIAIAFDKLKFHDEWTKIGELGLWFSLLSGGATSIIDAALKYLKTMPEIKFALGRSNNEIIYKYVVSKFPTRVCQIPIIGKTLTTKPDDRTLFFNVSMPEDDFNKMVDEIVSEGKVIIEGEPF